MKQPHTHTTNVCAEKGKCVRLCYVVQFTKLHATKRHPASLRFVVLCCCAFISPSVCVCVCVLVACVSMGEVNKLTLCLRAGSLDEFYAGAADLRLRMLDQHVIGDRMYHLRVSAGAASSFGQPTHMHSPFLHCILNPCRNTHTASKAMTL